MARMSRRGTSKRRTSVPRSSGGTFSQMFVKLSGASASLDQARRRVRRK